MMAPKSAAETGKKGLAFPWPFSATRQWHHFFSHTEEVFWISLRPQP
jgi:hypothetical protein